MAQLRRDKGGFDQRDIEVIVVGPENQEDFAVYWREHEMPFIGIADPDHKLADLYGQQVKWLRLGRMPVQFLIDRTGEIIYAHLGASMSDITSDGTIFDLVDGREGENATV